MLGDHHSGQQLEDDRLYRERGGEYSGGIQRVKGTAMADADKSTAEAERRFSEAIGKIWERPPLAKCSCCQRRFYNHSAIRRAEAEGCPRCRKFGTVEVV
jgi:hypothetical protein